MQVNSKEFYIGTKFRQIPKKNQIVAKNDGFDQKLLLRLQFFRFFNETFDDFLLKIKVWIVRKHVDLVDLFKSFRTSI